MRKVYLEGPLGQKFGEEWSLSVTSPAEALTAIMAQRPGMRQFLTDSKGIQGYEVLIDGESVDIEEEVLIHDPTGNQSYTFVPVIAGSKSSGLMMILGVTLIAMTGGLASFGLGSGVGFMGGGSAGAGLVGAQAAGLGATHAAALGQAVAAAGTGATMASAGFITSSGALTLSGAAAAASTTTTAILATQGLGLLGGALLLGGAAMMLAPDVPDSESAEQAENYLFGGPVNTVKQGEPIPLVYGRAIVGSKTISASIFTETSREKLSKNRNMVGITGFREAGSQTTNDMAYGGNSRGYSYGGKRGGGGPNSVLA